MRRRGQLAIAIVFFVGLISRADGQAMTTSSSRVRQIQTFDTDWRFIKGDPSGAESSNFDDREWRKLDVPHDWSIEGPFDAKNPAGGAGAFLPTGVGWYRKHFKLDAEEADQRTFVEFDGVMANSDVWINGFHLGQRPYGYVSFHYDLSGHVNFGGDKSNVIAVRVDDSRQPASRWYAGAGINRHVRLIAVDPVHFALSTTFVTTPSITKSDAVVHVRSTVVNQSGSPREVGLEVILYAPNASVAARMGPTPIAIPAGKSMDVDQGATVHDALLWNLQHTNLYTAAVILREGGRIIDDDLCTFGIRDAKFEAATGFWLNGQNIKIRGVCLHDDLDGLGTAVPLAGWVHRLTALKEIGCNAIRTSHNPAAPEFLDLCDRMGFLVMDEMFDCWTSPKNAYDYSQFFRQWSLIDLRDTVHRDRNHPCIVLYSAGNEIRDTPHPDIAVPILKSLVQTFHENDPTRPVTQALFRPNSSHDFEDGLADLLDVVGVNYRDRELLAAHAAKPALKIIGTENGKDPRSWLSVRDNAPYAGLFLWAGADYLGEAKHWPSISRENGLLDLTDRPRPIAFQRQSWWSDQPMVSITRFEGEVPTGNIPGEPQTRTVESRDWTPENLDPHDEQVRVFSNAQQVELLLNGQSLGSQDRHPDEADRAWKVHFQPGTLKAIARNGGSIVATDELRTAGKATGIKLSIDRAELTPAWDDIGFVTVSVVDAAGVCQPHANDLITFHIDGPGQLVAVESGDVASTEPFQFTQRKAYLGTCTAIVRATSTGEKFHLTATAEGLVPGSIEIATLPK